MQSMRAHHQVLPGRRPLSNPKPSAPTGRTDSPVVAGAGRVVSDETGTRKASPCNEKRCKAVALMRAITQGPHVLPECSDESASSHPQHSETRTFQIHGMLACSAPRRIRRPTAATSCGCNQRGAARTRRASHTWRGEWQPTAHVPTSSCAHTQRATNDVTANSLCATHLASRVGTVAGIAKVSRQHLEARVHTVVVVIRHVVCPAHEQRTERESKQKKNSKTSRVDRFGGRPPRATCAQACCECTRRPHVHNDGR